jgi:hypothetical protein
VAEEDSASWSDSNKITKKKGKNKLIKEGGMWREHVEKNRKLKEKRLKKEAEVELRTSRQRTKRLLRYIFVGWLTTLSVVRLCVIEVIDDMI